MPPPRPRVVDQLDRVLVEPRIRRHDLGLGPAGRILIRDRDDLARAPVASLARVGAFGAMGAPRTIFDIFFLATRQLTRNSLSARAFLVPTLDELWGDG